MSWAVTRVLVKLFALQFYKQNFGLLLFFFLAVVGYFFFINVLNETHLTPADRILNNLLLVITVISSPVMAIIISIFWLVYTIKSWYFVASELRKENNQFLSYSITALQKRDQFMSWCFVQFIMSLPLIGYCFFSFVIGFIYEYYAIPVLLFLFIVLLICISAALNVFRINRLSDRNRETMLSLIRKWPKPLFIILLYQTFLKQIMPLIVTKILSCSVIVSGIVLYKQNDFDQRIPELMILTIVVIHTVIIYNWLMFENTYLTIIRNLPLTKTRLYFTFASSYFFITLPEIIALLFYTDPKALARILIFNIATGMLLRGLQYKYPFTMTKFISLVFYIFIISFLLILSKLFWLVIALSVIASIVIFAQYYHRQKSISL